MNTRFFFTIATLQRKTVVTSRYERNVKFLWKRFLDKFEGYPVIEKSGNRVVFDVKGIRREVDYGVYTFDSEDPYKQAITI